MLKYNSNFIEAMEAANHLKNSAMEAENHFLTHGASSKSLMSRGNWMKKVAIGIVAGALVLSNACNDKPDNPEEEPEVVGNNIEISFARVETTPANTPLLMEKVQEALDIVPAVDTVFLVAQEDWGGMLPAGMNGRTNNLEGIKNLDTDRVWGKGIINPDEIAKSDSIRLALMKFIVDAGLVLVD